MRYFYSHFQLLLALKLLHANILIDFMWLCGLALRSICKYFSLSGSLGLNLRPRTVYSAKIVYSTIDSRTKQALVRLIRFNFDGNIDWISRPASTLINALKLPQKQNKLGTGRIIIANT